jgi:hypothetical protein
MVGAEEMAPKGDGHNDEGKGLASVAHGLHSDELPIDDAHAVVAEERAVGAADFIERGGRPWGLGGEAMKNEGGIGVVGIGRFPVQRGGRSVGVMKEDRDGIVTIAGVVIQGVENGVHDGLDNAVGSSEGNTRS